MIVKLTSKQAAAVVALIRITCSDQRDNPVMSDLREAELVIVKASAETGVGERVFATSHGVRQLAKWWKLTFGREFDFDWWSGRSTEKILADGSLRDLHNLPLDCGDGTGNHSYRVVICGEFCYVERFIQ